MTVFEDPESEVRSYCRTWPVVFDTASGSRSTDVDGRSYLDSFAGAGALDYGHNPPVLKAPLLEHLGRDGITHGLDMHTTARRDFLDTFQEVVLAPRGLQYEVQLPGPTGANTVESALKLAREISGREAMIDFTNAFHGTTLGALSVTGNSVKRHGAGLDALCTRYGILLIVDDVQVGVGRTGPFSSFGIAGIQPGIVCLSESISGYGLPMALTLIEPELDVWGPGEHNGTFRGHNPAFVTAKAALDAFWRDDALERSTIAKGERVEEVLTELAGRIPGLTPEGRGLARGLQFDQRELAAEACAAAFERGLLMETSGPTDEVMTILPPLTITDDELEEGLAIVRESVTAVTPMGAVA